MPSLEVDQLAGFLTDPYTVREPTHDRVMATSLVAQWRFNSSAGKWSADWEAVYAGVKTELVKQFAVVHSLALQQTLYEMGKAVLEHNPVIAECGCRRSINTISATTCRDLGWQTTTKCSTQTTVRTV